MLITDLPSQARGDGGDDTGLSFSARTRKQEEQDRKLAKWQEILENFSTYQKKYPTQLAQRIREGVPKELRAQLWREITKIEEFKSRFGEGVYQRLAALPCPHDTKIELDLHRTFPNHSLFKEKQGAGQNSLRRVMIAYSNYDSFVGYCQGMSFLAGMLLMELSEEDSFFALVQIMSMHKLRGNYQPGLPGLALLMQEYDYQIQALVPDLHAHFVKEGVRVEMFAPNWFITVFVHQFPLRIVQHIWDVFLNEGMEVVFRVALAVMKLAKDKLLAMPFEDILMHLKSLPQEFVDSHQLILSALNVKLDSEHLTKFFHDFHQTIPSSYLDQPSPRKVKPANSNISTAHSSTDSFEWVSAVGDFGKGVWNTSTDLVLAPFSLFRSQPTNEQGK